MSQTNEENCSSINSDGKDMMLEILRKVLEGGGVLDRKMNDEERATILSDLSCAILGANDSISKSLVPILEDIAFDLSFFREVLIRWSKLRASRISDPIQDLRAAILDVAEDMFDSDSDDDAESEEENACDGGGIKEE